ncbi:MAG: PhzF family phenazine biosynthesis protein [bacterium]
MKTLPLYQVDAFCRQLFKGNPAAVCIQDGPMEDALMQSIAAENNLSETAFLWETDSGFSLRWFTPTTEVKLCGHATLATSLVLREVLNRGDQFRFSTRSGMLEVEYKQHTYWLNMPAYPLSPGTSNPQLEKALGLKPRHVIASGTDWIIELDNEQQVIELKPDLTLIKEIDVRGVIVTAESENADFCSRFFGPAVGVNEDPVTGSAHCALTPYWSQQLGKKELLAVQHSERGGVIQCKLEDERVLLGGEGRLYLQGHINLD